MKDALLAVGTETSIDALLTAIEIKATDVLVMPTTHNDAKLEPALLNETDAATFTSPSRRAFRQLITRGDINPFACQACDGTRSQ